MARSFWFILLSAAQIIFCASYGHAWWQPQPGLSWQIQLEGRLDLRPRVAAFDLDLFDASSAQIRKLKSRGIRVICYFNAGGFESWRSDARRFPRSVKGRTISGWPGERWLDVRRDDILLPIMKRRLDYARAKGCDAVDPDNVDGYDNATGFKISYEDQLRFNRALAAAAHERGLAVGLKNDLDQVGDLVSDFDFAVNEQCFQYNECGKLTPFTRASKPVFGIEYRGNVLSFCRSAQAAGYNFIVKRRSLGAWRQSCN